MTEILSRIMSQITDLDSRIQSGLDDYIKILSDSNDSSPFLEALKKTLVWHKESLDRDIEYESHIAMTKKVQDFKKSIAVQSFAYSNWRLKAYNRLLR